MEITMLCLIFCLNTLSSSGTKEEEGVSIRVIPGRSQFFKYDLVSLGCESSAGGNTVKRNRSGRAPESCAYGWGRFNGSFCTIFDLYPQDSGLYWCETEPGEHSHAVNITVTAGSVILESPVLHVMEGDAVTLNCTTKTPSNLPADFYKDGFLIRTDSTGEMTIHSVSKSDEGLYKCSISGVGESPESWLAVRAPAPPPAALLPVSRLMCHLVVGTPYLLSTIVLGLIFRDRRRAAQPDEEQDRSHAVIMEME
ncbi:low affinity immunoglobulin gamma Fc region receptor II-a-like [Centroberyx affinis]|uniref:low affinity immunoglobulin gamma Fc region receptor II-a-like n=1 Tax=Centroberyx affinis TaxID=166261 RepID=UPI003A5BA33D